MPYAEEFYPSLLYNVRYIYEFLTPSGMFMLGLKDMIMLRTLTLAAQAAK